MADLTVVKVTECLQQLSDNSRDVKFDQLLAFDQFFAKFYSFAVISYHIVVFIISENIDQIHNRWVVDLLHNSGLIFSHFY